MGLIDLKYEVVEANDGRKLNSLSKEDFESFNSNILGLGDISQDGNILQALVAIFDLEGFTEFFNQIDPHIVVPEFLSKFLSWLFGEISAIVKLKEEDTKILMRANLPFFAKFLGDGILFIWDARQIVDHKSIGNFVIALRIICNKYISEFLPKIKNDFAKPPIKLRCGIARGQIISIGNGYDFVGPCINVASRLQKLGNLSFAFSRRGFDIEKIMRPIAQEKFILKKISIRGIGEEELVYIARKEFDDLSPKEKKLFKDA
jgi:class 3 adenylate cyclase